MIAPSIPRPEQAVKNLADRARRALWEEKHTPTLVPTNHLRDFQVRRLLPLILGVAWSDIKVTDRSHVVEVQGLRFTAELDGQRLHGEYLSEWTLSLWYICPKCQESPMVSDPIRSLADLGRALRIAETDYCARCGH